LRGARSRPLREGARGEITRLTGIDSRYEPPPQPHLHLHTDTEDPSVVCSGSLACCTIDRPFESRSSKEAPAITAGSCRTKVFYFDAF